MVMKTRSTFSSEMPKIDAKEKHMPKYRIFTHVKSGDDYRLLMYALNEANLSEMCVYQSLDTDIVWVRSREDFYDGRFKEKF